MELQITNKYIENFINQFENCDKNIVKISLDRIIFVSNEEFEKFLYAEINNRYIQKQIKIALFPISKLEDKHFSSSGKIGYILENIRRLNERYIIINPSIETLRAEKIKKIILIDDSIGSGQSVINFLKHSRFISIRSWVSYHKCEIDILSYAIYEKGKQNIQKRSKIIKNYFSKIFIYNKLNIFNNELFINLFLKYGKRTIKNSAALGYKKSIGFIVFQHSCPNNLPSMYWCNGKNKSWKALFVNQGINESIAKYFISKSNIGLSLNSIANIGKYKLALNLLEQIENKRISKENIDIINILVLISKNIKRKNFQKYIIYENEYLNKILDNLVKWSYITKEYKITNEGKYILKRYENTKKKKQQKYVLNIKYLPKKFGGVTLKI